MNLPRIRANPSTQWLVCLARCFSSNLLLLTMARLIVPCPMTSAIMGANLEGVAGPDWDHFRHRLSIIPGPKRCHLGIGRMQPPLTELHLSFGGSRAGLRSRYSPLNIQRFLMDVLKKVAHKTLR